MSIAKKTENLRHSNRRYVSHTELINISFELDGVPITGHLINSSVGGIGVRLEDTSIKDLLEKNKTHIIDITFAPSGMASFNAQAELKGYSLTTSKNGSGDAIICGFSFNLQTQQVFERKVARYSFNHHLRPTFYFENQLFYYERIFGNILECSSEHFLAETSIRNNSILPGMPVRLVINIPLFGDTSCDATVLHIKGSDKNLNTAKIGFKIQSNIESFQALIAPLILINNPNATPKNLRREGFHFESFNQGISFEYASSEEEKLEISELRWIAWRDQDEHLRNLDRHGMLDEFDRHSRHLVARINGKIVAAARLVYNNGLSERCEHLRYGAHIPNWIWENGFIETSRLVTHPEYRGSDLFLKMIHFLGRTVIQSGYSYLISSCEPALEGIYKQSGAVQVGKFTDTNNKDWILLLTDVAANCVTKGTNPISWNIFQRNEATYLFQRKYLTPSLIEKIRIYIYMQFAPLANWVMKKKFAKRNRKHAKSDS